MVTVVYDVLQQLAVDAALPANNTSGLSDGIQASYAARITYDRFLSLLCRKFRELGGTRGGQS